MGFMGAIINGIDTYSEHNLILLTDIEVELPQLKETRVDVGGMDGSLNMSYALTGEPTYDDREVSFSLYKTGQSIQLTNPERQWLLDNFQGREVDLILPPIDTDHYFHGVFSLKDIDGDDPGLIPVKMTASPWRFKLDPTVVTAGLTGEYISLTLRNERRRVVPTIQVTEATTIVWNNSTKALSAGTYRFLDIQLEPGANVLQAKTTSADSGGIIITYQEAQL